jgi:Asp/Glu/hydantoin racemase
VFKPPRYGRSAWAIVEFAVVLATPLVVSFDNTLVIAIPPVAAMLPLSVIGVTDVTVTLSVTVAQRFGVSLIISTCELHRHQELFLLQHLSLQLSCLNYPVGGSVLGYCGVCCV